MRVAWVIYGAITQTTGGTIYDRLVVERLRACGDDVRVSELAPEPRVRALSALDLARRVARLHPEVVVGDELCFRELAPAFAALPRSIARVLLVHHLSQWELPRGPRRALVAMQERAAILASDAFIATSATTAARLVREQRLACVDVAVPGADRLPRHARGPRSDRGLRLVFVGSWIPRKQLLLLLSAFERAHSPDAELVLIGDPTRDPAHAARVRSAIAASPFLRERVSSPGLLGDAALAGALAGADALVLPSALEGYGMVLAEAVHAGLPVLASAAGAIPEVVRHGAEAILFDGEDGLTEALRRYFADAPLRARMRAAAEARAPALPTWDTTAGAVRAALARAAAFLLPERQTC